MGKLKRIWNRILNRARANKVDHIEPFSQIEPLSQREQEWPAGLAPITALRCRHRLDIDSCAVCSGRTRERAPERVEGRDIVTWHDEELRNLVREMSDKLSYLSGLVNRDVEPIDAQSDDKLLDLVGLVRLELDSLSRKLKEWAEENRARF